jgi:steroid 5-alpha reductase family enzyme
MFDAQAYLTALVVLLAMAAATWLLSVRRHDVSIVDTLWSLMFLAAGTVYLVIGDRITDRAMLVYALLVLWSVRLAAYITWRNWGEGEDHRYRAIRARNEPGFAVKSLYLVFGLQAMIAWIISLPLLAGFTGAAPLGWLDALAVLLFVVGFVFEVIGDWQLASFRKSAENRDRVLDTGLWRYTRHPNYFGNACIWWGFFVFALSAGGWWSIVSPILMTFLLLRVSGVALLEKDIGERRPAYREYIRQTSAFVPWWPRERPALAPGKGSSHERA